MRKDPKIFVMVTHPEHGSVLVPRRSAKRMEAKGWKSDDAPAMTPKPVAEVVVEPEVVPVTRQSPLGQDVNRYHPTPNES